MRRILVATIVVLLAFGVVGAQDLKEIEEAYLKVVRKVRSSVVAVTVVKMMEEAVAGSRLSLTRPTGIIAPAADAAIIETIMARSITRARPRFLLQR